MHVIKSTESVSTRATGYKKGGPGGGEEVNSSGNFLLDLRIDYT